MANNKYGKIADAAAKLVSDERLRISFDYIDWESKEFFFHGMEQKYYQKAFDCISEIKKSRESDITQQTHPRLTPKSIFNTTTSIRESFPEYIINKIEDRIFVETRDAEEARAQAAEITTKAFEIYLSKNYGRFHGFIWNNTFHLVWFDPAHNLYPMKKGITKHKDAATVRCYSPDEVKRLQEKIKELQHENSELYEAFAEA